MDEESSMSSFNDENDENFVDKENEREQDDDETDEHERFIYEQQQYQRSQFYEQQTYQQRNSEIIGDAESPGTLESNEDQQSDNESSTRSPKPVPDYLIDKIENERWPYVNGHYDDKGEWREWNDVTTVMNTYSGELVTILEYTIC